MRARTEPAVPLARRLAIVILPAALMIAVVLGANARRAGRPDGTGEFTVDGKVFGMPHAEVFTDNYEGPPVTGEYVTMAPALAELPPGNRTHHVRMDVLAQQIELAPGVRLERKETTSWSIMSSPTRTKGRSVTSVCDHARGRRPTTLRRCGIEPGAAYA